MGRPLKSLTAVDLQTSDARDRTGDLRAMNPPLYPSELRRQNHFPLIFENILQRGPYVKLILSASS